MVEPKKTGRPAKADHYDAAVLVGFTALVAGMWLLSPPWALIVGGVCAAAYGMAGSWRKGMGGD